MLPSIISGMLLGLIFKKFVVSLPGDNLPAFLSDSGWIFPTIVFYCVWTGFAGGMIVYPNMMNGIDPSIRERIYLIRKRNRNSYSVIIRATFASQ